MRRFNELRWAVASTLAKWSGHRLYRPFKALLWASLLMVVAYLSYSYGEKTGIKEGVDFFHSICYNNSGFVMNEEGQVVVCQPLTIVPKEEMLDKGMKV